MAVTNKVTKNEQALLEDDDDFEEFPTEGKTVGNTMTLVYVAHMKSITRILYICVDWTTADEDAEDTQMWEDNWDDDNVEDDFSMQLRYVI